MATGQNDIALSHARLSARQQAQSAFGPALESIATALRLAPAVDALWAQFSELIRFFNFRHPVDPWLRELLGRALEHPAVDPGNLVRPISSLALSRPAGEALRDPLLLRLLEDALIRDAALEALIVAARRAALESRTALLPLASMAAIAHQCFNSEYLYDESGDETARILQLHPANPEEFALYACYRPLHTLPDAERVADELARTALASLARRQILEPLEERRLRDALPRADVAAGGASQAVQAQYEEHPYPRWLRTQTRFEAASPAALLRELFPHAPLEGLSESAPRLLVAGCGTGQNAIACALRFRDARVLAVDLSRASLAYAMRKSRELGLERIEYRQADLLAPDAIPGRFDLIEASGVLHHLAEPFAGWQALAARIEPGGLMRVGLYSRTGRRNVARARELIAAERLAATPGDIRRCRAAIRAQRQDPLLASIAGNEDFFSMSGCRDLLFHVQESAFDLPQIAEMISRLGLAFLGFEFPDSGATAGAYRARFPADAAMTDLANWHRLEQERPDSFARMYQFWLRAPR
ncbi:MAG TPA: methyltransferase domain-containing protein [Burkholderiales bacterium]